VTTSAQRALNRLKPTSVEVDQVVALLTALKADPFPAKRVPFIFEQDLFYSDMGRFRAVFQIRPSTKDPPGSLVVVGFTGIS